MVTFLMATCPRLMALNLLAENGLRETMAIADVYLPTSRLGFLDRQPQTSWICRYVLVSWENLPTYLYGFNEISDMCVSL